MLAAAGLLISLLSKPLLLLVLPLLLLLKETRRAACAAVAVYVAVSLAFLLVPALNPTGDNYVHWLHMWQVSGMDHYTAAPSDMSFKVPGCARELFSLSGLLHDFFPFRIPTFAYHLPLAGVLAFAVLAAKTRGAARRATLTLIAAILGIEVYYLSYTVVWEYHYTTLLPTIPLLWWLYRSEKRRQVQFAGTALRRAPTGHRREAVVGVGRRTNWTCPLFSAGGARRFAAALAFWSSMCVLLPTLYFLFPVDPESHQTLGKFLRVIPTVVAFVSLLAYGAMVAADRGIRDWGLGIGLTARRPIPNLRSLIPLLAAGLPVGAVLLVGAARPDNRVTVCMTGDQASQCRKMAEVLPNRPQLWVFWGEVLLNAERYDEAARVLEETLRRHPEFAPAHQTLAKVLQSQGKLPRAAAELQRALQLEPENAEYHADLGAVRLEQGDLAGAERESLEALRRNPAIGEARKTLSLIRLRSGAWRSTKHEVRSRECHVGRLLRSPYLVLRN
jgi:hypothetical protein